MDRNPTDHRDGGYIAPHPFEASTARSARLALRGAINILRHAGILAARHHPGLIQPGDCLAVVAAVVEES